MTDLGRGQARFARAGAADSGDGAIASRRGVVTLSRRKLEERGGRWLKLVSGRILLGLGALLIGRPAWLGW